MGEKAVGKEGEIAAIMRTKSSPGRLLFPLINGYGIYAGSRIEAQYLHADRKAWKMWYTVACLLHD